MTEPLPAPTVPAPTGAPPRPAQRAGCGAGGHEVEALDRATCIALLAGHRVGRLAVVGDRGQPEIFPISYVADGANVVFRSGAGKKLAGSSLRRVALEIDSYDLVSGEGWSVVVKGTAREITDALDPASCSARELPVEPWTPGEGLSWLRIVTREITGRHFRRSPGGDRQDSALKVPLTREP